MNTNSDSQEASIMWGQSTPEVVLGDQNLSR